MSVYVNTLQAERYEGLQRHGQERFVLCLAGNWADICCVSMLKEATEMTTDLLHLGLPYVLSSPTHHLFRHKNFHPCGLFKFVKNMRILGYLLFLNNLYA